MFDYWLILCVVTC